MLKCFLLKKTTATLGLPELYCNIVDTITKNYTDLQRPQGALSKERNKKGHALPEGCHLPITNNDFSLISEERKLSINVLPYRSHIRDITTKVKVVIPAIFLSQPVNPRSSRSTVKLEKKLVKEVLALFRQIGDTKTTFNFRKTEIFPCNFTLTSMAPVFSGPKESSLPLNKGVHSSFKEKKRDHLVDRARRKDRSN